MLAVHITYIMNYYEVRIKTSMGHLLLGPKLVRLDELVCVGRPSCGFEVTLRFEDKGLGGLPLDIALLVNDPGELPGWCMILSLLTKTPCFSLHLKYLTPFTVPLCFPACNGTR